MNTNHPTMTNDTSSVVSASLSSSSSCENIEIPIAIESTANTHANTSTNPSSITDPYKDFSGVDTESFISTTLRNNPKDRTLLLTLETVLQQFIHDEDKTSHQFQAMNSCKCSSNIDRVEQCLSTDNAF
jgi:hypothetical protein